MLLWIWVWFDHAKVGPDVHFHEASKWPVLGCKGLPDKDFYFVIAGYRSITKSLVFSTKLRHK